MPDSQRDANISRLFNKMDDVKDAIYDTNSKVDVSLSKLDDFSYRLKKLEEHDEKHIEREEKLEILMAKVENFIDRYEKSFQALENRVYHLEQDVDKVKNNWGWLITIITAIGGIAGYVVNILVNLFMGKV